MRNVMPARQVIALMSDMYFVIYTLSPRKVKVFIKIQFLFQINYYHLLVSTKDKKIC